MNNIKSDVIRRIKEIDFSDEFVKFCNEDNYYSYSEFFAYCLFVKNKLVEYEVHKRQIVLLMENGFSLMAMYFAILLSDNTAVAIDPQKGEWEVQQILECLNDSLVISDSEKFKNILTYKLTDQFWIDIVLKDIKDIKTQIIASLEKRDFNANYLITFTSGTSGNMKGVKHSLESLFHSALSFSEYLPMNRKNTFLHVMPMTYMAGILNTILQPFICNSRIFVMGRFSPKVASSFWKKVTEEQINTFWLSPMMLLMILKMDKGTLGNNYCKDNALQFLIGTAPLTEKIRNDFEKKYGVSLYASYGLSETLFLSTETEKNEIPSVGMLLQDVSLEIGDDGELLIDVPWMFQGYLNENTDKYFTGNFYKSGDVGKIIDDRLHVTGRIKDLIIRGGMNISPKTIENVIMKQTDILECCVFGVPNKFDEENIVCAYVSDEKQKAIMKNIIGNAVNSVLGSNYRIDDYLYFDELPKNANGKIDKNTLIKIYKGEAEC